MSEIAAPGRSATRRTLPGDSYASPEVFARERERVFAESWLCAGRASTLARPGEYALFEIAGESVIVVRDASNALRAFFNVCRHRGSRLCESASGRFPGAIVCPYHAWTYGLDGELVAARNMTEADGFERAEFPLHAVRMETVAGFVFVNLGRTGVPTTAAEFLAPLAPKLKRWDVANLVTARSIAYELACNWKLVFQNYSECYHCPVIHPQLAALSPWDSGANDLGAGAILGGPMDLGASSATMSLSGASPRAPLGGVCGDDLRRVYYYSIFPSMLLSLHPDYVMTHLVQPLAADRTRVVCEWLFAPDAVANPGFDAGDVVEFWDRTNRQDWHICELTQLGVSSCVYVPGPYSPYERVLPAFDDFYLAAMA